jgi:hypothetical protein
MITKNNYFKEVKNIDYNGLPEALKEGFDTIKFGSKDYSTWKYLDDDKEFLDIYFDKLSKFLSQKGKTTKSNTKAKSSSGRAKTTTSKKAEIFLTDKRVIKLANKAAENVLDAKEALNELVVTHGSRIPEKIVLEVLKNYDLSLEMLEPKPVKKKPQKTSARKSVQKKKPTNINHVERTSDEIRFIKRYVLLNGKVKTKHQILLFLNALQRAITEKRIRKTSKYAKQVIHIQDQLVSLYNEMPEQIKVEIDTKIFDEYRLIADSEKSMISINYIKRFISLHGKTGVKEKAKRLHSQMLKAVNSGKLGKSDPYKDRLESVYTALRDYIDGKSNSPSISKAELNGLIGLVENNSLFSKKKAQIDDNLAGLQGVISSVELSEMHFDTIGLTGKYKDLIGDPSVGFSCMVYGKPKSGKSTMCIDFAKHLAENHGKVLYAAIEEGYGYTMKEKLERLHAIHPNLFVSEDIPEDLSIFNFVFIDSVSKGKVDNERLNQLIKFHPKTAFLFIFHATKEGDFRGGQENAHDVDCIIEVKEGDAYGRGRFGVGGEISIFN